MGDQGADGLDPDAYGRVTSPDRFLPIQAAARSIIDGLLDRFDVQRTDGVDLEPSVAEDAPGSPATRLVPRAGAPITFTFTTFPAVIITYGYAGQGVFPRCGCDACDEDPAEEASDLIELIENIVAGGLTESRSSDKVELVLADRHGPGTSGRTGPASGPRDGQIPTGTTDWPEWPQV